MLDHIILTSEKFTVSTAKIITDFRPTLDFLLMAKVKRISYLIHHTE